MRVYARGAVCGFRYSRAAWGELSNFWPLPTPITVRPWTFSTSEHLYQAAKFVGAPARQARIAGAATPRDAKALGRASGIAPGWSARRVDVMRWTLRLKREANAGRIDAVLERTGDRPIVEISARDVWWGARPVGGCYEGCNVLGRLWMELRGHLRDGDPAASSDAWIGRIRTERLAEGCGVFDAAPLVG